MMSQLDIDENELHPNWKERLDYVISRANVQIADMHKNTEFIIQRATNFIGTYNVLLTVFMVIVSPLWLKILTLGLFVWVFYKMSPIFATTPVPTQGFTASIVDYQTHLVQGGKETHLIPEGFFVNKETSNGNYYGWLFKESRRVELLLIEHNKKLSDLYTEALNLSKKGWATILGLWLITVFWDVHPSLFQALVQAWQTVQSLF